MNLGTNYLPEEIAPAQAPQMLFALHPGSPVDVFHQGSVPLSGALRLNGSQAMHCEPLNSSSLSICDKGARLRA